MSDLVVPAKVYQRLEQLYEISKLLATHESAAQAFYPALTIVMRTLPLRSAIVMEAGADGPKTMVWPPEGQRSEELRGVEDQAEAAYGYLVGPVSTEAGERGAPASLPAPPRPAGTDKLEKRLIAIPLVVARRPAFGVLQLEAAQTLDREDLIFVNAIANQLAIALDRDRARQRDITRREDAEEGRTDAEARGATAERDRISAEEGRSDAEARGATAERELTLAESASARYEALAGENARLYEEAQRAVRGREQILAVVSHDLRSPLGTILMTASMLAKGGDVPQAVGRIQRATKAMLRLIEDLLDFASIEAGRLALRRQPHEPGALIQEAVASFEASAQGMGLRLTAEVEPQLPPVHCDRDRLLQVLANLVGNATKVTAEGGQVTLRAQDREQDVLFEVSDTGPGISAGDLVHLFERYWRSDEAAYKGTGLGLAIARGIVSAHGGQIWAESELGRGARFLFTIPKADVTLLFAEPTGA